MGHICFCVSPQNVSEIPTLNANLVSIQMELKGQSWRFQDPVVVGAERSHRKFTGLSLHSAACHEQQFFGRYLNAVLVVINQRHLSVIGDLDRARVSQHLSC